MWKQFFAFKSAPVGLLVGRWMHLVCATVSYFDCMSWLNGCCRLHICFVLLSSDHRLRMELNGRQDSVGMAANQ